MNTRATMLKAAFSTLILVVLMLLPVLGLAQTYILQEDFASIVNGNSTTTGGSSTAWLGNSNFPTVVSAYQAGGAVKLGTSSLSGSITSKTLDLSVNGGSFSVGFTVKGWTTVEGGIKVTVTGLTPQTVTYTAVMSGSFEPKTLNFAGGTANSTVKIETTAKRAFIDDVNIYYVSGSTAPILTADITQNDVDHNIDINFTDNSTWRAAVTAVKIGGTALTATTDYLLTSGNLQLKPSGLNTLLTTAGSKAVTVEATGFNTASVTQVITAGAATKLAMKTQPVSPPINGAVLSTQPAVYIQDQYGNTTANTDNVSALVGAGTWTIGGTTPVSAIAGTATFTDLTATSAASVNGATISFTSGSLTGTISNTFNIPAPPLPEPTNQPTAFSSVTVSPTFSAIDVTWTDATGGTVPEGYVVKAATGAYSNIGLPVDGTPETAGSLVMIILPGIQIAHFTGLTQNTQYYFEIFPFTNSNANINYKTTSIPQATSTTTAMPVPPRVFISEYIEGSSSNKAIEIYNGENTVLDMTKLVVKLYANGTSTATSTYTGTGSLDPNASFVLYNSGSNTEITASGNAVSNSVINFNGDDALEVIYDGQTTDVFGTIGTDPGTSWTVAGNATGSFDKTLLRKLTVTQGNTVGSGSFGTDAATSEWVISPVDYAKNLGEFGTAWTGTSDVNWATSGNWDMGAPTGTVNAVIPDVANDPVISASSNCKNLLIASFTAPLLTIGSTGSLTVNGTLANKEGTTGLVVNSGGTLIQNSASVPATVQRDINAWGDASHGWHFLSSPVEAQAIDPAFTTPVATEYDFYAWWEPTNVWVNYKNTTVAPVWNDANGGLNFNPGKGYLVEYKDAATKQFTGTLNKDNITVSNLAISAGTNKGWHLLGNPFTAAIQWGTAAWSLNNINATAKIWKEADASYVDITTGGPNTTIPAMNGFMVQVNTGFGGNNSLVIPASARVTDATAWYKSGSSPYIVLVANDPSGHTAQESVISFNNAATIGFDPAFDAHFLTGYAPQFYSVAGTEQLSTNVLPAVGETVQVPVAFIKNEGSSFTINASTISGINGPVMLNDLKTSASQDLSTNPVYTFTSTAGDDPNRFMITFSHLGTGEKQTINPYTYHVSGNRIIVTGRAGIAGGSVFVYNMMGQLVAQQELTANSQTALGISGTGYYLVKVVTTGNTYSGKVFVNQ